MKKKGLLLVVSGPSGAGKGTICAEYMKRYDDCSLSVSATTRAPREGEIEGKSYYFLSTEEFEKRIKEDGFLEHACFCGNYYGTPKEAVMKMIESGTDVILEIEVQGAMQVRSHYPESVFVFVIPPSKEELKNRLVNRGTEKEEVILERLERAKKEYAFVEKYNYVLVNDDKDAACSRLRSIVEAEKCVMARNYELVKKEFID